MVLHPKKLLLIDCLGALLSAFLLGIVLVRFESSFGMPRNTLYFLSATACLFAMYSGLCYVFLKKNHASYLKWIAFANMIYCSLTLGLMFYFYKEMTLLGVIYFLVEVSIIATLAVMELRVASK
jgi:hypothetical protein